MLHNRWLLGALLDLHQVQLQGSPRCSRHSCTLAVVHCPDESSAMASGGHLTLMSDAFIQMTW